MTELLYYKDSHLYSFDAVVLSCEQKNDFFLISLDKTAFFPEGGGQFGDIGSLTIVDSPATVIPVFDTHEKDSTVFHYTKAPIPLGTKVHGEVDWDTRFSRMQQHSGEHIVSGLIHQCFGFDNVGFHLGDGEVTLDFNGVLTKEELVQIEQKANTVIWKNLPIKILYPTKEELSSMEYRSKIEIQGQVRIVSIPDVDTCACCAPHVFFTGEIGIVKLIDLQSHRGGVRITMLAGNRALTDYQKKEQNVKSISVLLSSKEDFVYEAVEKLKEEQFKLNGRLMQMQEAQIQRIALQYQPDCDSICLFENELDPVFSRELVNLLTAKSKGIVSVFHGTDQNGYRYIIGSSSADVRPFCKELNQAFQGKGGGKAEMVQGSLVALQKDISLFCSTFILA